MSSLSQFTGGGGLIPKSIVNGGLVQGTSNSSLATLTPGTSVLTGALTAATLSTILSISGKGAISVLALQSVDATSRTHRVKITIDGTVVFDNTTGAVTSSNFMQVIGQVVWSPTVPVGYIENPILFNTSLLIEYASSLSETGKTRFGYIYYTR